jgi:uncharacterized protein (TIGR03437 family)
MWDIRALVAWLVIPPALAFAAPLPITARVGFEPNRGQFRQDVLYALRPGAYLTANGIALSREQVSIQFEGGNPAPSVLPSDTLAYTVNVFSGSDPQKWITGIRRFGEVQYRAVYQGIDVSFAADPFFNFRFAISPGADISRIRLLFDGARVTPSPFGVGSSLTIWLPYGRIGQNSTAYQETAAGRVPVAVRYTTLADNRYGFALDNYDPMKPVMIVTSLPVAGSAGFSGNYAFPSFLSRSGALYAIAAESALIRPGTPYQGATTPIGEICGLDSLNSPWACRDVAIYKYSPAGELIYVSYLRGTADDAPSSIAVDDANAVYVTGETNSADFPVTPGASQRAYAGPPAPFSRNPERFMGDAFVARFDANGTLLYSTYLGGAEPDSAGAIRFDASGNAYVGGPSSPGLPVTAGALQSTPCMVPPPAGVNAPPRPCDLGYIAKVDRNGRLAFLTYLPPAPSVFTVDPQGNTYFAGSAGQQAFLAKLNPSGSALTYNTRYSALGATGVVSIAVDSRGNAWLSGPVAGGVETSWIDGYHNPYLAKISTDGSTVLYQTPFIGGELALDSDDNLSVLTHGYGSKVVRTPGGLVTSVCSPVTISKLDPRGVVLVNRPVNATNPIGLTANGSLLAYQYPPGGLEIIPIAPAPAPDTSCMVNAASLSMPNTVAPGEIVTILGRGLGPAKGVAFTLDQRGRVPSSVGGVQVLFDAVPAPVLYADDGQVNAIAPFSLRSESQVAIQVEYQGQRTAALSATVTDTAPALFSRDASGGGQVLAFDHDGTLNSPSNPAQLGSIITVFATGTGITSPPSIEGAVATSIDPRPVTPPVVVLGGAPGGFPTQVLYAGPSLGSLTSVTQLNLRLPESLAGAVSSFPMSQWPILFYTGKITQLLTIALSP